MADEDSGVGGGLNKTLAGIPTWGWIGIATAGAVVGFMWFQNRKKPATPDTTSQQSQYDLSQGLATDQYESLLAMLRDIQGAASVPGDVGPVGPEGPPGPAGAPAPVPTTPAPVTPAPTTPPATPSAAQYVTVSKYTSKNPPWNSTLSGIARHYGTSIANLLALNPSIKNANLIYPNQQIRVR
jgi:LysM repeat protein